MSEAAAEDIQYVVALDGFVVTYAVVSAAYHGIYEPCAFHKVPGCTVYWNMHLFLLLCSVSNLVCWSSKQVATLDSDLFFVFFLPVIIQVTSLIVIILLVHIESGDIDHVYGTVKLQMASMAVNSSPVTCFSLSDFYFKCCNEFIYITMMAKSLPVGLIK